MLCVSNVTVYRIVQYTVEDSFQRSLHKNNAVAEYVQESLLLVLNKEKQIKIFFFRRNRLLGIQNFGVYIYVDESERIENALNMNRQSNLVKAIKSI